MSKAGERLIQGAEEALSIVRGVTPLGTVTIDGKHFHLGQPVRSYGIEPDHGVICALTLPDFSVLGPVSVKWVSRKEPESYFPVELVWEDEAWEVLEF